ncbi:unnamed protein product [Heterosigma akashiwo]|mmetsp:Transcript_24256/g.33522  ORF Transcript_24256/g.33522 Transcript_24256/m.33522 type:complete len:102 (-) Transcript_24256:221-526(-)|eukprot:CAMPEP_0194579010 /NCGR_PEP_ID=MMETSP0292-20121207/13224_1 /TAXON_ID=39354 /ORGANISM="Heterosigma akashiwo, Strain CCMP2393" /LENGTH=101 /DNA_ID=CAMNT_0039431829 /DNA_START=72 /DNA_END=377 /DNA_ORIENTATION=-
MEDFINETISSNPCVVFSKTYCPYCTNAKQALQQAGAKMVVIELDQESNGDAIQNALAAMTGRRTVPNVFIAGQTIGGGDDTVALARSGQLAGMLADAGAL